MESEFIKDVIDLIEEFKLEHKNTPQSGNEIKDFKKWIALNYMNENVDHEFDWEGKSKGRKPESVISTLIVHINRYAKSYSKSAIFGSDFSSQEDFIYLINLNALGEMTKMDLIKRNVHEKPVGMQVINRLVAKGWVNQEASEIDKRSKVLKITNKGIQVLEQQMDKIRKATEIVTGDLTYNEKMELMRLLNKLNDFHRPIYDKNIEPEYLLEEALKNNN